MGKRISLFIIFVGSLLMIFSSGNDERPQISKIGSSQPAINGLQYSRERSELSGDVRAAARISLRSENSKSIEAPSLLTKKIESFFIDVPRKTALSRLTDAEVHTTPRPVLRAGELLAEMRDLFLRTPHPIGTELDFYLRCSQESEFLDSVRAVCAARAKKTYREATGKKLSAVVFEPRIAALSDKINL